MAAVASLPHWTVEQYLALERASDVRHEYVDGAVYALAGGSRAHGAITAAVTSLLYTAVRGRPCRVYSSDLKVRVSATRYLYPDVSVDCSVGVSDDGVDWLAAPRVVVEVLSESTAAYDRGDKRGYYEQVGSLQEYVLIETDQQLVEVQSRGEDGTWTVRLYGRGATVELPSLGVTLAVAAIYADVAVD